MRAHARATPPIHRLMAMGFNWFLGNFAGIGATVVAQALAHALFLHAGSRLRSRQLTGLLSWP